MNRVRSQVAVTAFLMLIIVGGILWLVQRRQPALGMCGYGCFLERMQPPTDSNDAEVKFVVSQQFLAQLRQIIQEKGHEGFAIVNSDSRFRIELVPLDDGLYRVETHFLGYATDAADFWGLTPRQALDAEAEARNRSVCAIIESVLATRGWLHIDERGRRHSHDKSMRQATSPE